MRLDPNFIFAHLLLAKIFIGQGLHSRAQSALDIAASIQPHHWQTHLMRLYVLNRRGKLHTPEARSSHLTVCKQLREACETVGRPRAYSLVCANERVRLAPIEPEEQGSDRAAPAAEDTPMLLRGYYGEHLHAAASRRKLQRDRYVVLRRCARKFRTLRLADQVCAGS